MKLDEGSRLYQEGMRLMEVEGGEFRWEPFVRAIDCFVDGAEKGDMQCWGRLCEMFETDKYFARLNDILKKRIATAILLRMAIALQLPRGRGVFTVVRRPIDNMAGSSIGSDRHFPYLREKAEKMAEEILGQSVRQRGQHRKRRTK